MEIPISRPLLGVEEEAAVARVLRSGWIMQGPEVAAFEREFAAYVGAPQACAVSSGTAALHLALLAVGVGPGDEVVTVSHSFIATANSIQLCGATPVFVDIDDSLDIDVTQVEAAIGTRTRAILCVHQLGMPCDVMTLRQIAARKNVALVEDAACAVGSEILVEGDWQRIGRPHSHAACFSFHPRKILTTGEGGMVTTSDPAIDARVRRLRQHGDGVEVGFNYRMTDLQAAIGRVQLERLPAMLEERRAQVAAYRRVLDGVQPQHEWARSNWQSLYVRVPDPDRIAAHLREHGVATRPGIANAHAIYAASQQLPRSEDATARGLMLPLYPGLSLGEIERIAQLVASKAS